MAAGGVDVLRRRDFRFDSKESVRAEKVSRVVYANSTRRHGVSHKNGDKGSRQDVFYGRTGARNSNAMEFSAKDGEASKLGDMVQLLPEKKRKFSPIIWDREEKGFSFKKRVVPSTPPSPAHKILPGQVLNAVSSGDVSHNQLPGDEFVEPSRPKNSDNLCSELLHHQTQNLMAEDEIVQERNISMSRWALEEDSPQQVSDIECTPYMGRSSPESGEFHSEASLEDRSVESGSRSSVKSSEKALSDGGYVSEDDCEHYLIEEPTVSCSPRVNMFQSCRSVFEYEKLNKINEGTYGVVYKAKDKKSGEIVALKKVKMDVSKDDYGFPLSSLREINILSSFSHPSIVDVKEVVMDDADGVYMVMEYMDYDLKGLMETIKQPFSLSEVKWLMLQLLEGVKYLHDNWVLHRDLKTSNLLLSKEGELKICDFGLSRQYGSPLKPYTPLVVTLWYRAPEILLGTKEYSTAIDMWSVGCIMAEFVAKEALFRGKTEVDQLDKIFRTLGTPNETIWPGLSKLPGSRANFVKQPFNLLRKKFPASSFIGSPVLSDLGFDLLSKLLTYDPEKRITAEDALNHNWFLEAPLPKSNFKPLLPALQGQNRYLSSRHQAA